MKLTAKNLKNELWETLQDIRKGEIDPSTANAVAGTARGIIATITVEIAIENAAKELNESLQDFVNDTN